MSNDKSGRLLFSATGTVVLVLVAIGSLVLTYLATWAIRLVKYMGGDIDPNDGLVAVTLVCVLLSVLLVLVPVCIYVTVGQAKRLDVIRGYYPPHVIAHYLEQFWAGRDGFADLIEKWKHRLILAPDAETNPRTIDGRPLTPDQVKAELKSHSDLRTNLTTKFNELLQDDFGMRIYVAPMVLLATVTAVVMYFGFLGGISLAKIQIASATGTAAPKPLDIPLLGLKLDLVSIAAIFGAYTWITSDSITRNYQSTFHPSDLLWYSLRLVIAVPLGQAISMLALPATTNSANVTAVEPGTWGAFLAFVISMFSFDSIVKYLGNAANRFTNTQNATPAERDDLAVKLPGVDEETARRLAAEGVTTIAQLVSVDPVRLSVRSGLTFDFVLALIDAAILWTYAAGKIACLREFGFKGASNILIYNEIVRDKTISQLAIAVADTERQLGKTACNLAQARQVVEAAQTELNTRKAKENRAQEIDAAILQADDAQKAALRDEKSQLEGALNALGTTQKLTGDLEAAAAGSTDAETVYNEARQKAAAANSDLIAAAKDPKAILGDMAEKASMKASGLENIFQQIAHDQYAGFIRLLMGVAPASE
ncbi:MAG TPA: hypothetical protein VLV76_10380 [Candidatus Acidoferrum sp.]|nr:hypothetical protein [Candidatus Acidoferrum sp.]